MTDTEAIALRADSATPGPWFRGALERTAIVTGNPDGYILARLDVEPGRLGFSDADIDFIAHARADIPELLAKVEELTRTLERHAEVAHNCISTLLEGAVFDHEANQYHVRPAAHLAVYNALVGISWDRPDGQVVIEETP